MPNETRVVVEVPVTLAISVAFPDGAPADAHRIAVELAQHAASSLGHVSHDAISAFNETNRFYHHATATVAAVETRVPAVAEAA